jgi:uncharacterized protein (DUF488 family)
VEIYTIGFTQRSATEFFETLKRAVIKRVIDVRLTNTSQLAGFAKRDDLAYFLKELCGAQYRHEPLLSPTKELRDAYRKKLISWDEYENAFLALMKERNIEELLDRRLFEVRTVLLCSELEPHHCHRRLVAEYLRGKWDDVSVVHL